MNKERYNQIIDEAYENYCKSYKNQDIVEQYTFDADTITKEMFIDKIKFNRAFSERWGLKIEERELSDDARNIFFLAKMNPLKQITVTYKGEKIEVYE